MEKTLLATGKLIVYGVKLVKKNRKKMECKVIMHQKKKKKNGKSSFVMVLIHFVKKVKQHSKRSESKNKHNMS